MMHHSDQEMGDPSVFQRRLLGAAAWAPARTWGWVEIRGWGWVPAPARCREIGRRLNRHHLVDSSKVWGWVDAQRVRHSTQYVRNTIEEVINCQYPQ